jgi:hypothetical protein
MLRKSLAISVFLLVLFGSFPLNVDAQAGKCAQNPVATDDKLILFARGTNTTINVLHNDSDPAGCRLRIKSVSLAGRGIVRVYYGRVVWYSYLGRIMPTLTDSFTYTIENSAGKTATAMVNILLYPENLRSPVIADEAVISYPEYFQRIDVLKNDIDPDAMGTDRVMRVESVYFDRSRGSVYVFNYSPQIIAVRPRKTGPMIITYTVRSEATGLTATGKLIVDVRDQPIPIANEDFVTTRAGKEVVIDVVKNDTIALHVDRYSGLRVVGLDPDLTPSPLEGKFRFGGNKILYTPEPGASGSYMFYYRVQDGYIGATSSGKVTVTIER